ncbi:uncharacterized protein AMSG_11621 [Thecamonas trahens ATCC 50062]|uniref:Uncharacterized protein n=1 Tax=Thecamonas trahens ATCC 50062 TaxID=461836 RepID=A0A0L0DH71_THETB|nr:hypothetical protein AMSG_11621 [Thecamonas trahens ATCC 50062]KNC50653.1 hypothetical protein AMSG_11621 [Thecamonas trahens ATCC 50062]|eukprot:XP_013762600.1 hypothetical protein AMSG_11621 [Thecamonas trahens ATCC 50062]
MSMQTKARVRGLIESEAVSATSKLASIDELYAQLWKKLKRLHMMQQAERLVHCPTSDEAISPISEKAWIGWMC